MTVIRRGGAVAWGARRRDYQLGSERDRRASYRRKRRALAEPIVPIVRYLDSRKAA